MLQVMTPEVVRRNQDALIGAVGAVRSGRRVEAYVATVNAVQAFAIPRPEGPTPVLDFAPHAPPVSDFLTEIADGEPFSEVDPAERGAIVETIHGGLELLARFDPRAPDVVRALVPHIVLARHPSRGGGSAANAVGLVWLNPLPAASALDLADLLWHEATHQALFLADMVTTLFAFDRREGGIPQITSAIRRVPRDYDLSFHAACVASALVELHRGLEGRDRADALVPGLATTLAELRAMPGPLAAPGRAILDELLARAASDERRSAA